ncbi:MAG: hypothetical protein SF002_10505 [Alphaproteobacteria bacterium]|nr:hypothetical protein [Alphaproteobacteria bacterium]
MGGDILSTLANLPRDCIAVAWGAINRYTVQMPAEIRHIIFSQAEQIEAITDHFKRIGDPLPSGTVKRIRRSMMPEIVVTIDFVSDKSQSEREIILYEEWLVAAFLAYCKLKAVPVPVKAAKRLLLAGDVLFFQISRNVPNQNLRKVTYMLADAGT